MPPKNSVKKYAAGGYYHIYNRGVEKRIIFKDKQDYGVFLSYLKTYLSPKDEEGLQKELANPQLPWNEKDKILKLLRLNNFADEISLLAYCLMPNHFHLLVKQTSANSIDRFMNSLGSRYVVYFNKKAKRVGPLFQGVYKAVLVESDDQLVHLSSYIHRNPKERNSKQSLQGVPLQRLTKQPSSLPEYLGLRKSNWVKHKEILAFFSNSNKNLSYESFVRVSNRPSPTITSVAID